MDVLHKTAEGTMTAEIDADPWVSVPRAAKTLGIHKATVRGLALRGVLRFTTVGGRIFVHRDDVDAERDRQDATTK